MANGFCGDADAPLSFSSNRPSINCFSFGHNAFLDVLRCFKLGCAPRI
jgi:hypothetical protein